MADVVIEMNMRIEEESMTTEARTIFGEVLAELMASRGIPATEERIGELASSCGLAPDELVARVNGELVGHLEELAEALGLSTTERFVLAMAYAFERRAC